MTVERCGSAAEVLRADLAQYDAICQRLQREARQLDRRAHLGLLPALAFLAGVGLWFVLR